MAPIMTKILIVDDEPRILLLMKSLLKANGYEVETARDGAAALEVVRAGGADVVVTDLRMQPMDGLTLFKEIKALDEAIPVILLTAFASVETAIEAMKSGIFDYLTKPFKVDEMLACLKRAEEKIRTRASVAASASSAPLRYRFENFIASSPAMNEVCETIAKVAPTAAESYLIRHPGAAPSADQLAPADGKGFLKKMPTCPKTGNDYTIALGTDGGITVTCGAHNEDGSEKTGN